MIKEKEKEIFQFPDGGFYKGEYKNDLEERKGIERYADGSVY